MVNQIRINAKQTRTESYKYVLKYQLKLVMKLANQSKWFWINALKFLQITVHQESIHSASIFPHFVMLQPYSKID